jgi:8-oxo-dGTP diphosphatase
LTDKAARLRSHPFFITKGEKLMSRGNIWLAVAGLIVDSKGRWLVVKKKYSGLQGMWSIPAGFVHEGETLDEAVIREVKEETGLSSEVIGLFGLRTGVIKNKISDNMIIFTLNLEDENQPIIVQEKELSEVKWVSPDVLKRDSTTSVMIHEMIKYDLSHIKSCLDGINPGNHFGYTNYKIFL